MQEESSCSRGQLFRSHVWGLGGKVLVAGGLQGWLLLEDSRSCPVLGKDQFQMATKSVFPVTLIVE